MAQQITQKLGFDAKNAIKNLDKLAKKIMKVNDQLRKMKKLMKQTGVSKITKDLNQAGSAAGKAGGKLKKFMQAFTGIDPITAGLRILINTFKEAVVESTKLGLKVAEIQTIGGQMGKSNDQITASVIALSNAYGIASTEVAEGLYQTLSNQVVKANQAVGFLNESLKLAKVTAAAPSEAINALSSALNTYGKTAGTVEQISNSFFKTVEYGRLRLGELGNIVGRVYPLTSELGVSLNEANAAIATMTRQGVKADTAVTQLRAVMQKIIKPTDEMNKLFRRWGARDGKDAIRTSGGLLKMLQRMSKEVGGSSAEMANFFRRVRAITATLGILNKDGEIMADTFNKIEKSTEAVNEAWAKFSATPAQRLTEAWIRLKNTIIEVGVAAAPALAHLADMTIFLAKSTVNAARNIAIAWNKSNAETYAFRDAMEEISKQIQVTVEVPAYTMSAAYKKAAAESLKAIVPIQRELFKIQDAIKDTADSSLGDFQSSVERINDKLGDTFKGLDKIIKAAKKIKDDNLLKLDDIGRGAEERKFEDRKRDARSEYQVREENEKRLSKLSSRLFSLANKQNLSEREKAGFAADLAAARTLANELKISAEQGRRRQDALRFRQKESSLDKLAEKQLKNESRYAEQRADKAAKLKGFMEGQADKVKEITKEIKAQAKSYAEAAQRTGPSAGPEKKAIKERIAELQEELSTFEITPEISAKLKDFDVSQSAIDTFNKSIKEGLQEDIVTLIVDLDSIQQQLYDKTFGIRVALDYDNIEQAAKTLNIDISGKSLTEGRQEAIDKAVELNQKDQENLQAQSALLSVLKKTVGFYQNVEGTATHLNEITKDDISNWEKIRAVMIAATGDQKGLVKYVNEARQAEADRRNKAAGVSKEYVVQEAKLNALFKRLKEGQDVSTRELSARQELIRADKTLSSSEKTRLEEKLRYLSQMRDNQQALNDLKKDEFNPAERTAINTILDNSKKVLRVDKQKTEEARKNTQTRQQLLDSLFKEGAAADGVKQKLSQVTTEATNTAVAVGSAKNTISETPSLLATAITKMTLLANEAERYEDALNGAGGSGGSTATAKFGKFFNFGGRGTDTIPAMLSAGETVVNARQSKRFFSQLNAMNQGSQPVYREQGGPVTNVGDVNVTVNGGDSSSQTVREIGTQLQREIRRGNLRLS